MRNNKITRRDFLKNFVAAGVAGALALGGGSCEKKTPPQRQDIISHIGYSPFVYNGTLLYALNSKILESPIERPELKKTLCDLVGSEWGDLIFKHPIKVGNSVQVIGYTPHGFDLYKVVNSDKKLEQITEAGYEYCGNQWVTPQGHLIRYGRKKGEKGNFYFITYKDGKEKKIIENKGIGIVFSPDGTKAYTAGPKIREYDVSKEGNNIKLTHTRTIDGVPDEEGKKVKFSNVPEIKAIDGGYAFICIKDGNYQLWKTDLNWSKAECLDSESNFKENLKTGKGYIAYEVTKGVSSRKYKGESHGIRVRPYK